MNKFGTQIRSARVRMDVSQVGLANIIGRSQWWVSGVERGVVSIDGATAGKILAAIDRLAPLMASTKRAAVAGFEDLRLKSRIEIASGR